MALALPDLADQIVQETRNPAELKPWAEVEKSLNVVATHSLLGEIGSSIWGLPGYVSDVISRHHNLSSSDAITLVDVVALANQLSHWLALEPSRVMQQELVAVSGKFGLDSDRVRSAFVEQLFGERHIRKLLAKTR
jgi:hypothetical protein